MGQELGRWPDTRFCAAIVARETLLLIVNLGDVDGLDPVVRRIASRFPAVRIDERTVITRMTKINGRLLGADGRSIGIVPIDPWRNEAAAE